MIKVKNKINLIKNSNLVFIFDKELDLKEIDFLSLNKEIVEKIQKTIEESKKTNDNKVLSFFI